MKCYNCQSEYDDNFAYCPYCSASKYQPPKKKMSFGLKITLIVTITLIGTLLVVFIGSKVVDYLSRRDLNDRVEEYKQSDSYREAQEALEEIDEIVKRAQRYSGDLYG